jgi:hypothetical protein
VNRVPIAETNESGAMTQGCITNPTLQPMQPSSNSGDASADAGLSWNPPHCTAHSRAGLPASFIGALGSPRSKHTKSAAPVMSRSAASKDRAEARKSQL